LSLRSSSTRSSFAFSARISSALSSTRSSSSSGVVASFSLASLYFCSCSFRFSRSSGLFSLIGVHRRSWSSFRRSGSPWFLSRSFCASALASSRSLRSVLLQMWSSTIASRSSCLSLSVVDSPLWSLIQYLSSLFRAWSSFRVSRSCASTSLFAFLFRFVACRFVRLLRAS